MSDRNISGYDAKAAALAVECFGGEIQKTLDGAEAAGDEGGANTLARTVEEQSFSVGYEEIPRQREHGYAICKSKPSRITVGSLNVHVD